MDSIGTVHSFSGQCWDKWTVSVNSVSSVSGQCWDSNSGQCWWTVLGQ